jgi:hypothetical protein
MTYLVCGLANVQTVVSLIRTQNIDINATRIPFNRAILQNVPLGKQEHESKLRNFRPMSPVKLISNFLSGNAAKQRSDQPLLKSIPSIASQSSLNLEQEDRPAVEEKRSNNKVTVLGASSSDTKDTLTLLQDTLATYLVSLHSRSGNMVGRVLRGRAGADELLVNELYNILGWPPSPYIVMF